MRADRLVAILMMLQTRGRVTATEVAEELEISERTARRDLDALGMAGLPVYSQQGRGGGWQLVGGGRTDLSGLTASEVRALFLVAGPSSATPELRAALRKLVRALPEPFREGAEAASAAMVVDPSGWGARAGARPAPRHLDTVQQAVVEGRQLRLGYVSRDRTPSERVVHPLGLAAKGPMWYLIADTDSGLRTFRLDRVESATITGDAVIRPAGFDLADAWQSISASIEEMRSPVRARVAADPSVVGRCRWLFGSRLVIGATRPDGRVELEVRGQTMEGLAAEVAGLGSTVEALDPPDLRRQLAQIGRQLVGLYPPL